MPTPLNMQQDSSDSEYLAAILSNASEIIHPALAPFLIDLHSRTSEGDTILHLACIWGDARAVRLLVEMGLDTNVRGDMGCTPLHYAVSGCHLDIVKYLLKRHVATDIKNDFGYTPLGWARQMEYMEIISVFEKARA